MATKTKAFKRAYITDAMVCRAVADWQRDRGYHLGGFIEGLLMERTGAPIKVVYAAMNRAYDRGFLECGVSLRTAWLTDEGHEFLRSSS